MKKFVSYALIVLTTLLAQTGTGHAADQVLVSHVEGAPMIVRNGQEMAATVGMNCEANDILKTTPGCQVDIALNDKVGCRILAESEVLLANANTADMQLKVNDGNVILNVVKLQGSTFKVETPTAVATVRGTQFWGRVLDPTDLNATTTFAVREGNVEVYAKSLGQSFTLNAGQALDIPKSGETAPVIRPALEAELAAMEQANVIKTSA